MRDAGLSNWVNIGRNEFLELLGEMQEYRMEELNKLPNWMMVQWG